MHTEKKFIILDLDETIIHSVSSEEMDDLGDDNIEKMKEFNSHEMKDEDGNIEFIVLERPGLQPFLDYIFSNFRVGVWTAASKDYALFIVKNVVLSDKNRELEFVLFDDHCEQAYKELKGKKNLDMLYKHYKHPGIRHDNVFILDDHPRVHNTQPSKCILMYPFQIDDEESNNDNFLEQLEHELEKKSSVTEINKLLKV